MNKYFITTAIPYINANAHIGHAQEYFLTHTLSRIIKSTGGDVLLQSGTDDNSLKNIETSLKIGIPIDLFAKRQGEKFKELLSSLNCSPDIFVQTSSPNHHQAVKTFIKNLNPSDLYQSNYTGLYCVGCEDFLKSEDLPGGLCPDHQKPPIETSEQNVFFRLSKYQKEIYNLISSDQVKIYPDWRKKEILNFIDKGLEDISISRPFKDEKWGVEFPNQEDHGVYVWIDALINYLTGIGYGQGDNWKNEWSSRYKIHVIGKNVWKFHAIYWIGLLLSAKIDPPNEILIHGFLTNEGVKISKSLGNAIDPLDIIKDVHPDVLRTFLLGKLNYQDDGNFSSIDLKKFYLDELVNQIGNLYPRVFSLSNSNNVTGRFTRLNLNIDFRNTKEIYTIILGKSQELNKNINDSFIWKLPPSKEKNITLELWIKELNIISNYLILLFPSLEEEVKVAFTERKILFPKPI